MKSDKKTCFHWFSSFFPFLMSKKPLIIFFWWFLAVEMPLQISFGRVVLMRFGWLRSLFRYIWETCWFHVFVGSCFVTTPATNVFAKNCNNHGSIMSCQWQRHQMYNACSNSQHWFKFFGFRYCFDAPVFCCFSILMNHLIDNFLVVLQLCVETFLELDTFQHS